MKKSTKIFLICFAAFLFCTTIAKVVICKINYDNNLKVTFAAPLNSDGLIAYQNDLSDYSFGVKKLNYNGCGTVAIYNVLKLFGKEEPLANIIHNTEVMGSMFYGLLGTSPVAVKHYLQSRGLKCEFITNQAVFESAIKRSKATLFTYYGIEGGHYQLVYDYNEATDTFKSTNITGLTKTEQLFAQSFGYSKFLITIN